MSATPPNRANRRVAMIFAAVAVGMVGMAFASVPLYRLFCQVTGYGGTTQRAQEAPAAAGERIMTVRFNADIGGTNLPWTFRPVEREVTVRVGEERLIFYRAKNVADVPTVGTAAFNVTPLKAGIYFQKIACFCFAEQVLAPGESMEMPVSFFIDPEIVNDPNLADVKTITLSYTFFRAQDEAEVLARTTSNSQSGGPAQPAAAN